MYTLVLMSAMSSAPETAEFNGFFRRLFSFGGCHGSCTGSCTGGGRVRAFSNGCCGGTGAPRGYGSCTGASLSAGSCTGSGYQPCSGAGYGSCFGSAAPTMAAPMTDFGGGFAQPVPATSNFYAVPSFYAPPTESGGCFGGGFTPVLPNMNAPGLGTPFAVPGAATPPPEVSDTPGRNVSYAAGTGGRATVVVKLPTDATLYAEGRRLTLAGAERTFTTPPLPAGDWAYTFKAEYTRDGETISRAKRIGVKAGETVELEFTEGGLARTTKRGSGQPATVKAVPTTVAPPTTGPQPATLSIKLPAGAKLTVDGKTLTHGGDFRTPPLAPGKEYQYAMTTEQVADGRPVRTASTVSVRAGELVTVDLTAQPK